MCPSGIDGLAIGTHLKHHQQFARSSLAGSRPRSQASAPLRINRPSTQRYGVPRRLRSGGAGGPPSPPLGPLPHPMSAARRHAREAPEWNLPPHVRLGFGMVRTVVTEPTDRDADSRLRLGCHGILNRGKRVHQVSESLFVPQMDGSLVLGVLRHELWNPQAGSENSATPRHLSAPHCCSSPGIRHLLEADGGETPTRSLTRPLGRGCGVIERGLHVPSPISSREAEGTTTPAAPRPMRHTVPLLCCSLSS